MNFNVNKPQMPGTNLYPCKRHREQGYVLLVLLFFVALLSIGFLAMSEKIGFQIKRDREEELIHRGSEYSRAVRKYVRQFGRYPNSIAELENTNNIRCLRKRYKDPITGKDFKILHYGDVPTIAGPLPNAGNTASRPGGATAPGLTAAAPGDYPDVVPEPGESPEALHPDSNDPVQPNPSAPSATEAAPAPQEPEAVSAPPTEAVGPAVVGVASYSTDKTIRVFNNKDHYNQWQFVYDPSADHTGLITTPNQPRLKAAALAEPPQDAPTPQQ